MSLRPLSPTVWTSAQLSPSIIPSLVGSGVARIINNRPDGEEPGQPTAAEIETSARAAGLSCAWVPIQGLPRPDQVAAVAALLADGAPTVMFCRSGMRSAAAWAMAERLRGADASDLRASAASAGHDLNRVPL